MDNSKPTIPAREQVDELFRTGDPRLIDDLSQAIARGCVLYDVRLPDGCLTAIVKRVLFTLDQRRRTPREVASGCLSKTAGFQLMVGGEYGPQQIDTIIRHLQVTRDTLAAELELIDRDWAE